MRARRVIESIDFERGQDPKSSMDVGTECRTFHAGSVRYNRGSTTYLDPEMAKRVLNGDDTLYHEYFISAPGSFGEKGFYMNDLQDPENRYCYIEYLGEIYPVPGKLRESVDFERGREPYDALRIGKNRFRPYPQMTPDEFREWYVQEIEPYYDKELGFDMVLDNIVNNEVESDEELAEYWRVSGVNPEIIKKIMPYRPYFLDFRYIQKIGH